MTVETLISRSLTNLGVLGAGQTAPSGQANYALASLNNLIDGWSLDRLLTFTITRATWALSSAASYTVGTGGTIAIARPSTMNMQGCNVAFIDTTASPYTVELPLFMLTDDGYQAIPQKTYQATYPTSWYYNPTYTSSAAPYGTLTVWPIPNVSYLTGVLYAPVAASVVALADTLALPPGYQRFYENQLAWELSDGYPVSAEVVERVKRKALEARGDIEKVNTRLQDLSFDLALVPNRQRSNVYTGGV